MILPTCTSMKLKFPEFANVEDATIEFAIEEASYSVGSNWTTGGGIAVMYLAAHLVSAGQAAIIAQQDIEEGNGSITKESIGRISIGYKVSDPSAAANTDATADDYESSSYGRRFIEMRDMRFGGPVVV
jgi:hypothetical protein